jgi:decaprenylphospho-beta-D-erythro-pentofuranosid-2-ulose 2-reductase
MGTEEKFVPWFPKAAEEVAGSVGKLPFTNGDIAIISLGSISLTRWEDDPLSIAPQTIEHEIFANAILPITVLIHTAQAMAQAGGGRIVVLSSVSAFPTLSAYLFYGTSKSLLDRFSQGLATAVKKDGVQIITVRPGFVRTKIHEERKFSFLPTNIPSLANSVVRALSNERSRVIWVPGLWSVASKLLMIIPGLKQLANRALLKSM